MSAGGSLSLLIAIAVMIVGSFAAGLLFRKFRVPDILFLIAIGVLMGPILHALDVEGFADVLPFIGTLALIFILFDGGLEIQLKELMGGATAGALLAVAVFLLTAVLCTLVAHVAAGLDLLASVFLGMAFGGAGVVIVIPLIQQLGVEQRSITIVTVEAAVSDVLVVIGVVGVSTAVALRQVDPVHFARALVENFSIGLALGLALGFLWGRVLGRMRSAGPHYLLTLAVLFALYAVTELLRGSGPMAVLLFGLVLGNSKRASELAKAARRGRGRKKALLAEPPEPVFREELAGFHGEIVFFIRTLFFVSLGVVLDLDLFRDAGFLAVSVVLALCVAAARYAGVRWILARRGLPSWDRLAIALMFPLGLAAAALSRVPHDQFQIPGTELLGSYALMVVVLTNLFATIAVTVLAQPAMRRRMEVQAPRIA